MNEEIDVKLKGWVLVNSQDQLLRRKKVWGTREETRGWIWSDQEVEIIMSDYTQGQWKQEGLERPVYKQAAWLNRVDGQTYLNGDLEKLP